MAELAKDVKEDVWRGRIKGELANPGSPGRMAVCVL